jgi:hypothetical protein
MRKVALLLGALLLLPALATMASAQMAGSFADVPVDHWAYDAVQQLADAGIIEGYPDYTFKGQRAMSRYEMATVIARCGEWVDKKIAEITMPTGGATQAYVDGKISDVNKRIDALEAKKVLTMDQVREQLMDQLLTPEQKALLNRLQTEFAPELRKINNTLADLDDRLVEVEDWIANRPDMPKITLSGDLCWRFGTYGDKIKLTGDVDSYPVSVLPGGPFFPGELPFIVSGIKDAFKAPKFSSTRTRLVAEGMPNDNLEVKLVLFADPRSNITSPGTYSYFNSDDDLVSPNSFYSDGLMDTVRFDEAYTKFKTSAMVPLTATVGRQYFKYGMGLLVDNEIHSLPAVKLMWGEPTGWNLTGVGALAERESFDGQGADVFGTIGQDGYDAWRLAVPFGGYNTLGLNWLGSGGGSETGWSADLAGRILGFNYSLEYAKLRTNIADVDVEDDDTAYVASVDLIDSSSVKLNAKYGVVEPGYALCTTSPIAPLVPWALGGGWSRLPVTIGGTDIWNLPLSALHPYASVAADYIDWLDRPLFLNPQNVAKGYEIVVELPNLLGRNSPLTVRYYDGDAYNPGYLSGTSTAKWRDADRVWTVSLTRSIAPDVDWNLTYGRREVKNVLQPDPASPFGFGQDEVQALRTEVMIRF